jgi:hypothetical protein
MKDRSLRKEHAIEEKNCKEPKVGVHLVQESTESIVNNSRDSRV